MNDRLVIAARLCRGLIAATFIAIVLLPVAMSMTAAAIA
jgi:hypothetical protein